MSEVIPPDRLSSRHRWQLAWALTWPSFLCDLLLWLVVVGAVRRALDEQSTEMIYLIGGVLSLFLLAPWIVRRTVRLKFSDFHLVAIRSPGGEETRAIGYRESLSVAWLLAWRTAVVAFVLRVAILLALGALRGHLPESFSRPLIVSGVRGFIELVADALLALLLFYLWLVSAAIRKAYSGFVLQVRRTGL